MYSVDLGDPISFTFGTTLINIYLFFTGKPFLL